MRPITKHCIQRLSERFLLDLSYKELNQIRHLIKTGYYIVIRKEENKILILTRYKGRYIVFVMSKDFNKFITAFPSQSNDMEYIDKFIKEFDK